MKQMRSKSKNILFSMSLPVVPEYSGLDWELHCIWKTAFGRVEVAVLYNRLS